MTESSNTKTGTNIKAVLWDLDGTLLDTESLSDKANIKNFEGLLPPHVQEAFEANGYILPWEAKKQILGLRASSWVPLLTSYAKQHWNVETPLSTEEFSHGWENNLNSFCEEIVACKGANDLVSQFAKQGLPMAIATSSRMAAVAKKQKRYGIPNAFSFENYETDWFWILTQTHFPVGPASHENIFQHMSAIVCGDDPELENGKPAPDIYLLAAQRLGVNPRECLVFEDAMSGVKAGKAAGCFVAACPDRRFSKEERAEFEVIADVVIDDLSQFDMSIFGIPHN